MAAAGKPLDENHPYGHQKYESFASAIIGVMLILAAWRVGSESVSSLIAYAKTGALPPVEVTATSFAIMLITLAYQHLRCLVRDPPRQGARQRRPTVRREAHALRHLGDARRHPVARAGQDGRAHRRPHRRAVRRTGRGLGRSRGVQGRQHHLLRSGTSRSRTTVYEKVLELRGRAGAATTSGPAAPALSSKWT